MSHRSQHLPPQILVLAATLALWSLWPKPELWSLVVAYGLAWLVVNLCLDSSRGLRWPSGSRRWLAWFGLVLVVAGPLSALARMRYDFLSAEGLYGNEVWTQDRLRLERLPALAPGILFTDHPQSLYAYAPGAQQLTLDLGPGVAELPGTSLGEGLFRIEYDPRRDGIPEATVSSLPVQLSLDGRRVKRELTLARAEAHPRWFASNPEAGLAATVSEESDELYVLSRQGLLRRQTLGDGPSDVAWIGPGTLAVAHRYEGQVHIVDARSGEVQGKLEVGPLQHRLATSPDGSRLAVAVGGTLHAHAAPGIGMGHPASSETNTTANSSGPHLRLFSLPDLMPEARIELDYQPDWLSFGEDAQTLAVSNRAGRSLHRLQLDPASERWQESAFLRLGRPAVTMTSVHSGAQLAVAVTDYRFDGEEHRGNHFIQDQLLRIDTQQWIVLESVPTARRTPRQTSPGDVDSGLSPMGLVQRQDGDLLVTFAGSGEAQVLDGGSWLPEQVYGAHDLELIAPHGVGDLGDGHWVASSPAGGAMAVFDNEGALRHFVGVAPKDGILWDQGPGSLGRQSLEVRAGEYAFYEGTRSGISCQSCHLHGATDYSRHDIGQQPLLPTLNTRGVGGTAPYLRDGSFARVRDLNDHLATDLYRGYLRDSPQRRLDLETYVELLPREVNPLLLGERDLERERAGLAAFVRASCHTCHSFPAFTNLSQHPVRTVFPDYGSDMDAVVQLDTPGLLGSHGRDHFLQDGRAHDLEEVLVEFNESNQHGNSARLSARERADLIHFLRSL